MTMNVVHSKWRLFAVVATIFAVVVAAGRDDENAAQHPSSPHTIGAIFGLSGLHVSPGTESQQRQQANFVDIDAAPTLAGLRFSWDLVCSPSSSPATDGGNSDRCKTARAPDTFRVQLYHMSATAAATIGTSRSTYWASSSLVADSGKQPYTAHGFTFSALTSSNVSEVALAKDSSYRWVVVLDGDVDGGGMAATASATFRTTLAASDWEAAEWIGGGTLLRGSFSVGNHRDVLGALSSSASVVTQATLYATSLGCFSARLNGQPASDSVLDPGFSTVPPFRLLYRAMDVTSLVNGSQGAENTLDVFVGM